ETAILPRLREFRPDLVVISAGFDAHMRDPLANLNFSEADFGWATRKIMEVADASAEGRVVSVLEGGYDLEGLARSVAAHVTALTGPGLNPGGASDPPPPGEGEACVMLSREPPSGSLGRDDSAEYKAAKRCLNLGMDRWPTTPTCRSCRSRKRSPSWNPSCRSS